MSLRGLRRQAERLLSATEPRGLRYFLAVLWRGEDGRLTPDARHHGSAGAWDVAQQAAAARPGLVIICKRGSL
jgi:hypothetical protein